jgi:tetratricopeptide (TPR) repeat protein
MSGYAEQWTIKVRLEELDRGEVHVKNRWNKGETISVQIEPHATVSMLKQRVALIVAAHEKWQTLKIGEKVLEDNSARLDSIEGLANNGMVSLYAKAPVEKEEDLGELSEDPDALEEETEPLPPLPEGDAMDKELTEEEEDKQNAAKGAAAELLEDGDKGKALEKLTEAVMVGNPNAMLLTRRGELLVKMKRPKAAIVDTTAALKKNPDSAKAYKIRGKAHRFLSKWVEAVDDFAQCQQIDFDDAIADMHKYCTKRKVWHMKTAARAEKKAKEEEKAASK